MKNIIISTLCAIFAIALLSGSLLAFDKEALEGQMLYTRTNFKTKGRMVYFHNMSKTKGFIPVGTAVTIKGAGLNRIDFKLAEGDPEYPAYTLEAPSEYYERYFVKNLDEIGLKNTESSVRDNIKNMAVTPGMTKEEVYISRGCPAFIDWGIKSWDYPLEKIMESDTWYYNADTSKIESLVIFENGVVSEVGTTIKKQK